MKKLVFLLVAVLLGFQALSQKGYPLLPYGNYTIEEVRGFALGDSKKSQEFCKALMKLVQKKLREADEDLEITEKNVSWIFDQITEQEVWLEPRQFRNSRWLNDTINFYVSESKYEGNAGIFVYGNCSFPLYKVSCANLLDASLNNVPSSQPIVVEKDTVVVERVTTQPPNVTNVFNINSFNKTQATQPQPFQFPEPEKREKKKFFGRVVVPILVGAAVGTAVWIGISKLNKNNRPEDPIINDQGQGAMSGPRLDGNDTGSGTGSGGRGG